MCVPPHRGRDLPTTFLCAASWTSTEREHRPETSDHTREKEQERKRQRTKKNEEQRTKNEERANDTNGAD
jgi:hypothetical protein